VGEEGSFEEKEKKGKVNGKKEGLLGSNINKSHIP